MQILFTAAIAFLDASRFLDRYHEYREVARSRTGFVSVGSSNKLAFIFVLCHVSCLSLQNSA
jgi:hypothetical protein